MWKVGKKFLEREKIFISRPAELLFATGIPVVAFIGSADSLSSFDRLIWFYPLLLAAGWHILVVNDVCFGTPGFKRKALSFYLPVFAVPVLLLFVLWTTPFIGTVLALIVVNWDLYSRFGKSRRFTGLCHNFVAGALHYIVGISGAGAANIAQYWPEFMFFAFAMTGGAIHHDACHFKEDAEKDYKTGAVCAGAQKWWSLGIIPMLAAQTFLFFTPKWFSLCFGFSFMLYFFLYLFVVSRKNPADLTPARIFCRLIFALGAIIFASVKFAKLF